EPRLPQFEDVFEGCNRRQLAASDASSTATSLPSGRKALIHVICTPEERFEKLWQRLFYLLLSFFSINPLKR
ncbi:hypothetical protein PENTCL1PPCAC_22270, partial [Pristionchus entomophagus]